MQSIPVLHPKYDANTNNAQLITMNFTTHYTDSWVKELQPLEVHLLQSVQVWPNCITIDRPAVYNLLNCISLCVRSETCTLCTSLWKQHLDVPAVILCRPWLLMSDDRVQLLSKMPTGRPILNFGNSPVFSFGTVKQPTPLVSNLVLSSELSLFWLNVTTTSLITPLSI